MVDEIGIRAKVDALDLDTSSDGQTEKEFSAKAQVDDLGIKMDNLEMDIHNLGDSKEDDRSNNGEYRLPSSSEHNVDLHDASDISSYHSFVEEEDPNGSDVEDEIDSFQLDDEDGFLPAMLKNTQEQIEIQ